MAETKVTVTLKPDKGAIALPALKDHFELLESLLDVSCVSAPSDVTVKLDVDYDDDARILVATWSV